jgi:septal ring factor EnvC (AmiA/AmiB activator)
MNRRFLLAFCTFFFTTAFAMAAPNSGEAQGEDKLKKMEQELQLSPQQIKEIRGFRNQFQTEIQTQKAKSCELKSSLENSLMSSTKGPEFQKQLEEKFAQYRAAHNEEKYLRFKLALKVREILNEEQTKKFNALQREHGHMDKGRCQGHDKD